MAKAGVRKKVTAKGSDGIYYEDLATGRRSYIATWRKKVIHPKHAGSIIWRSVEKRVPTLEEAKRLRADGQAAAREPLVELDPGKQLEALAQAALETVLVPAWVDFVQEHKLDDSRSPESVRRDASLIRTHIAPYWSETPVTHVRKMNVQAWVKTLSSKLKPATVAKVFGLFKSAMEEAVENVLIEKNPARNVDLPPIEESVTDFLEVHEVRRIAEAMDPRYRLAVLLGGLCGLRWQETFGLTTDDLFLDDEYPHVWVRHGLKRSGSILGDTKTKHSARQVTLTPELVMAIQEHLDMYPDRESELCESPKCGAKEHEGVLITNTLGGPVSYWHFRKRSLGPAAIEALGEERGRDVHFHLLRHSHVRHLQDVGDLDSWDIADRLGQAQLRTARRYSKTNLSRQATVAERLAEVQSG